MLKPKTAKAILAVLALITALAFIFFMGRTGKTPKLPEVEQAGALQFEIADTEAERMQGLSGRSTVPQDGLLFVFPEPGTYGFWMKDMLISIDMIWIAEDGSIVAIDEAVSPDTYPNLYRPPVPVRYVLETEAGDAKSRGWSVGTRISLPLF